jgi:DNA-binding MarR family transcriptional regulator
MHRSHHTPDDLGDALLELTGFIIDPRQDWRMTAEAGLDLDPVLLPLLVRLAVGGEAGVVELAGRVGRDHSTISRQLARLEAGGLVMRSASTADGRVRTARLTPQGEEAVAALSAARRRLLDRALAGWTAADRLALTRLLAEFAQALRSAAAGPNPDGNPIQIVQRKG